LRVEDRPGTDVVRRPDIEAIAWFAAWPNVPEAQVFVPVSQTQVFVLSVAE
jgi:hypothetical protein